MSPLSRFYAPFHPLLLSSLFAASFPQLVRSPIDTLSASIIPLVALQSLYLVTCLPAAGTASGTSSTALSGSSGSDVKERKRHASHSQLTLARRISTSILSLLIPVIVGTPLLYTLTVLFGAPLTTHTLETLLLAAHMSILAGAPLVYVHGMDGGKWAQIVGLSMPWDGVFGGSLGVLVGAWFGAVPIPLDWDRAWQAYPITIITGAYIGYAVFSLLGRCPGIRGKVIRFNDEKVEKSA
ncbi:GPI biosynthesis protein Pig-F [Ascosphaera apis ARSEF 7405]|uniref:GPI biosynthesis protein Pig-F n=1 Tax=Ascosphaera apis ARSEF 7405 TaxID=392613 RepID=A0A167VDI3_9EURO|nr:GPI biosynthesis protein Pig-F [Ascosphaera apis ARSEF 7405]